MGIIRPQSNKVQKIVINHQKWGDPTIATTINKIGGGKERGAWPSRVVDIVNDMVFLRDKRTGWNGGCCLMYTIKRGKNRWARGWGWFDQQVVNLTQFLHVGRFLTQTWLQRWMGPQKEIKSNTMASICYNHSFDTSLKILITSSDDCGLENKTLIHFEGYWTQSLRSGDLK